MFKRLLSYVLGFGVALLAVAPPLNYSIPVLVNSFWWLYGFIVFGLLAMYLLSTKLPDLLKVFMVYLFVSCFFGMAPYVSFNAFILAVAAAYCYLGFIESDYKIVIDMATAAFFVQVLMSIMQLLGHDKLMNFDRGDAVFFGTVMQYMRFGTLLAIMTPLLVYRNKLFLVPILIMAVISQSSGFGLAVIAGIIAWALMTMKENRIVVILIGLSLTALYCVWDSGSISIAFTCGRVKVWEDIVRTWLMNTSHTNPDGSWVMPLAGPIDWKSIFVGRGLDTFMPLFPIFKHDANPFGQAHNCHLQLLWETGVVGYGILAAYFVNLVRRVWSQPILVAGLVCMAVNMFFSFPTRETQTMLMMLAFMALCEQVARRVDMEGATNAC
jgi:hypothetical protein